MSNHNNSNHRRDEDASTSSEHRDSKRQKRDSTSTTMSASDATTTSAAAAASSTVAAAAPLSFSFSSTSRTTRRPVQVQPHLSTSSSSSSNPASRHLITGSLSASSLAASHAASQDSTYGKGQLVIPMIEKNRWRLGGGENTTAVSGPAPLPPASSTSVASLAKEFQQRDAGKKGGIQFESEAEVNDREHAPPAAVKNEDVDMKPVDDSPPPLQSVSAVAAASASLDEQALRALEDSAMTDGSSSHLPALDSSTVAPILLRNALPGNTREMTDAERLEHDVEVRPDDPDDESYSRVPISEFGFGMLRGMGWAGIGDTIGGINKAVVKPVEFKPRGERMGLGAEFAKPKESRVKKYIKPGETREQMDGPAAAAAAADESTADRKANAMRALGSRLIQVHSQQLRVDAFVEIIAGKWRKSYGRIISWTDDNTGTSNSSSTAAAASSSPPPTSPDTLVTISLNLSDDVVTLRRDQIDILDARAMPEDHPAFETRDTRDAKRRKIEESERKEREEHKDEQKTSSSSRNKRSRSRSPHHREKDRDRHHSSKHRSRSRSKDRDRKHERRDRESDRSSHRSSHTPSSSSHHAPSSSSSSSSSSSRPRWIRPSIRVRFVSRSLRDGQLYRTKGVVIDVASASRVSVRPDGERTTVEQAESQLETVLPATNQNCMILTGEHRGSIGKLLQKMNEKEIAVVQLEEDLNIIQISFDDIAEYVRM